MARELIEETVIAELADPEEDRETEVELKVICGPEEDRVEVRDMAPENPLRLVNVTVMVSDEPEATVSAEDVRAILKSGITTVA